LDRLRVSDPGSFLAVVVGGNGIGFLGIVDSIGEINRENLNWGLGWWVGV
jgi:hypothetical protein